MTDSSKKPGLFGRGKKIEELQAELEKAKKEADKALKEKAANTEAVQKKAEQLQKELDELRKRDLERLAAERQKSMQERQERITEAQKPKVIKVHTVEEGETLSHVALKYYGHATPPYWGLLKEHNKEVLRGKEFVYAGLKLEIPELPEELKK